MKYAIPDCPKCGERASGTLETLTGCAQLEFDEAGDAEYVGGTEIFWDSTISQKDEHGNDMLICRHCGTAWGSPVVTEADQAPAATKRVSG